MSDIIVCPNCNHPIEMSAAFSAQVKEKPREEFSQRLDQEREHLRQEAQDRAKELIAVEVNDLQEQLTNARKKLGESQQAELELRKDRRELEDEKQKLELTVNRKLDEERTKIREIAKAEAAEENQLRDADKERLVSDLRRQITDLKRRAEQGSPQAQGEILELELEDFLRSHFPLDTIEPVPVGEHGGDVLHHIHDANGFRCGTILWEFKRTKAWRDTWLPKLRDDQRRAKAHLAVLMTVEMPRDVTTFGFIDGVWVTNRACLLGLAVALRAGILEAARTKRSMEGKHSKVELLLSYLSNSEFRQRIEGIVEAFMALKEDLDSEKRSVQRLWAKREKQIERAVRHTAGLYGDLGGIIGPDLPQIANFELAPITAAEDPALAIASAGAHDDPFCCSTE